MLTSQIRKVAVCLCLLFVLAKSDKECDKRKCNGPIRFYEELRCQPIYENPNDCCAVRYDCSHLSRRDSKNHCYANGREYNIGESLREEDKNDPCESCTCQPSGKFEYCATPNVAIKTVYQVGKTCFNRFDLGSCYSYESVCLDEGEEKAKCEVDGKTYLDGEDFSPESRLDLDCRCRPGFKGEFIEPFCMKRICGFERENLEKIYDNCAPLYFENKLPQMKCSGHFVCHDQNDEIIPARGKPIAAQKMSDNMKCKYGNLLMNIGDKVKTKQVSLNYGTVQVCASCECEMPPVLTCRQVPNSECGITPKKTHGYGSNFLDDVTITEPQ